MFRTSLDYYYLPPIEYSRSKKGQPRSRQQRLGVVRLWMASILAVCGSLALTDGVAAQQQIPTAQDSGKLASQQEAGNATTTAGAAPKSVSATAATPASPLAKTTTGPAKPAPPKFLSYSEPTAISAPTVGITSGLISVGKTESDGMEVPAGANFDKAAWYRNSPTPGQFGASIIVGHVDSYANDNGASVFYNLPKLKPGDPVDVKRADGSTASFTVKALRNYGKTGLPNEIIYAPVTEAAELRLITCSGTFIAETGTYDSNTVVFATLRQ